MKSDMYWALFMETGSPEAYLMYNEARRMEQAHVPEYQGPGSPGRSLQ